MMLLDKITLKGFSPSLYLYFLTHTDAPLCNPHDVACLLRSASRKMSSFPRVLCVSGYPSITLRSSKPNMKFKAGTTSLPGSPTHSICVWVGLPPIMTTGFPGYVSKMREPGRNCIGLLTPPQKLCSMTHCEAQAGPKSVILMPQLPECWEAPCTAFVLFSLIEFSQ